MTRDDVPAVRILPMSDKLEGFRGRSIEDVQRRCFLRDLTGKGRFRYPSVGLSAEPGTVVLFQYRARIIASAVFLRDEKFAKPRGGCAGALCFDPDSVRTFDPVDADGMRNAWPRFGRFGHVRQSLNPAGYPTFKRRQKNVTAPTRPTSARVGARGKAPAQG